MPSRSTSESVACGKRYTTYAGDVPVIERYAPFSEVSSLNESHGHYGWPDPPGDTDIGGSFSLSYNRIKCGSVGVGTIQGGTAYAEYRYSGSVYMLPGSIPVPAYADADIYGATAYRKMKPDRPSMNGLNAIYELKDVPGMLMQRFQAKNLHEIGDYYLALKFGWEALLNDIVSFVVTQRKAQERLKQILRDEGKPVKRRIILSDSSSNTYAAQGSGNVLNPSFVGYFYGQCSYQARINSIDRIWAAARYRYWLPEGPRDVQWTNAMLAKIFGFKPTPAVVWRAIPWSWLIDWFSNVGDMIDNLETSLVDRLAADYFYTMRNVANVAEVTGTSTYWEENTLKPITVTATGTREAGHKTRLKGDPFGWGTPENSLSGTQLSIMGALGLSRLR